MIAKEAHTEVIKDVLRRRKATRRKWLRARTGTDNTTDAVEAMRAARNYLGIKKATVRWV